jgi:hypothetical protein
MEKRRNERKHIGVRMDNRNMRAVRRLREILVSCDASTTTSEEIVDTFGLRVGDARQHDEEEEDRKGKVRGHASSA